MLIRILIPVFALLWLTGCSGELARMQTELDRSLMACDTTLRTFETTVNEQELAAVMAKGTLLQSAITSTLHEGDTLELAEAKKLDRFLTAYRNATDLQHERQVCVQQTRLQRQRIVLLKSDLANNRGSRSEYAQKVRFEKQELTKIRTHCNDIRLRFEELKAAVSAMRPEMYSDNMQP